MKLAADAAAVGIQPEGILRASDTIELLVWRAVVDQAWVQVERVNADRQRNLAMRVAYALAGKDVP